MWLPMLLLAVMASGSACPDLCQCRPPLIECRGHVVKLNELNELPPIFTELELHDANGIISPYVPAELSQSLFLQRLQALKLINFTNETPHLDLGSLPNLRSLNISHSHLVIAPLNYNCMSHPLCVLDSKRYRGNAVVVLSLTHMPQLTVLSLTDNRLNSIPLNFFAQFTSLEYLDLSYNDLDTLAGIFDGLQSLQRLSVAGNKLQYVQANWFRSLSKLVELDISRNKLTFIPADTLQPLTSLSVFKLAENPLIERDLSLLLGTGRRLEIVDASRIGLVRVPAALTRSVRTLKLTGNQLTSINSGDLDSYPLLKLLDLSSNWLMIIEEDALGRLDGLEELILSGNMLPTIPKSLPSSLRIFDLRQNAIPKLKANDLQGLSLLKELNLSGNVIHVIEEGAFRQLSSLEKLDISDNPIKKLPSDTLSGPTNLMSLRMSGLMSLETEKNQNQDTAFPFLTPERLVTLDVSRSPALAAQLLADNAFLSACKSLQKLDLSYTNISRIRSDLIYVLPQLRTLNLIGNEWNCSTDQFWLGEWLRQHESSIEFSTRCTTPVYLEGKQLEEMPHMPSSHITTIKVTEVPKITTTSKTPEIKSSPIVQGIVSKSLSNETKELKKHLELSTTPKVEIHRYSSTENLLSTTESEKISISTTTTMSAITTQSTSEIEDSQKESEPVKNESLVSPSISYKLEEAITATNEEEWPNLSTTSDPEEYTPEVVNYESTQSPIQSTNPIDLESNQNREPVSESSNTEYASSTINSKEKVIKLDSIITPTPRDVGTVTTDLSSTLSPTSTKQNTVSTSKTLSQKQKQPAVIKIEASIMDKYNDVMQAVEAKLLLANKETRANDEHKSIAEELNSQATVSGARTSESLANGAHPGMLVLLGAAIGAAAALTVVLSRRATVKRRDRQYQRHENIEVHALTPTTELW